ncbi:MAG: ABC transporter permease [Eubacteriales bacterium]|nr:ABC transporter permease [Eubacteriales bacterium]
MNPIDEKKVPETQVDRSYLNEVFEAGAEVTGLVVRADSFSAKSVDELTSEKISSPKYTYWGSVWRRFFSSKVAIFMLVVFSVIFLMSMIHPLISGYDHLNVVNINDRSKWFLRPSAEHLFGTDDVGRDMFALVWSGARTSLFISIMATLITLTIGVIVGMWWGFSKRLDVIMIEIYNIIANVPFTLIVMILAFTTGGGVWQLIFALSCTSWIGVAYFIRVQVMIRRDREYNLASKCLGSSSGKIIKNNIFPYLISVLMTIISRDIPSYISYEVFLSYIGVGLSEKVASLGRVIETSSKHMQSAPYLFFIPLVVTALISVSLYIVGQTLADASDPRNHMI